MTGILFLHMQSLHSQLKLLISILLLGAVGTSAQMRLSLVSRYLELLEWLTIQPHC